MTKGSRISTKPSSATQPTPGGPVGFASPPRDGFAIYRRFYLDCAQSHPGVDRAPKQVSNREHSKSPVWREPRTRP